MFRSVPRMWSDPLLRLLAGFAAIYLVSTLALHLTGRPVAVPWSFLPYLLVVALPLAIAAASGLAFLPQLAGVAPPAVMGRLGAIATGVALIYASGWAVIWAPLALGLAIASSRIWDRQRISTAVLAAITVALGYACVWNGNYLLAANTTGRLHDAVFVAMDASILGREYRELFPLWSSGVVFTLLERSYLLLFPQVIVVLLCVSALRRRAKVARCVAVLFAAYAAGLSIFAVFPTVGPPIYVPGAIRGAISGSLTAQLMAAMAGEYHNLLEGGPLNGFGYFVAFPSLHVAAAVILQRCMRPSPWLYWTWVPVTVLLILSTVILGYHYLLDAPAGLILGLTLSRLLPDLPQARGSRPDSLRLSDKLDRDAPVRTVGRGASPSPEQAT